MRSMIAAVAFLGLAASPLRAQTPGSGGVVSVYPAGANSSISPSTVTVSNLGQGRVVYTQTGGVLASSPTFTVSPEGNHGVNSAAPHAILHVSSPTATTPGILIDGVNPGGNSFQIGVSTFVVAKGGFVGVGAAVPNSLLHVSSGGIVVDGNGSANSYINNGGQFGVGTATPCSTCSVHVVGAGGIAINSSATNPLQVLGSGNTAAKITATGASDYAATINGTSATNAYGLAIRAGTGASNSLDILSVDDNAGNPKLRVKNTGNTGIGAATPNRLLHVSSGAVLIDGTGTPPVLDIQAGGTANTGSRRVTATGSGNIFYGHGDTFLGNTAYSNPFTTSINTYQLTRNSNDFIGTQFVAYSGMQNAKTGGFTTIAISTDATSTAYDMSALVPITFPQTTGLPAVVVNVSKLSGTSSGNMASTDIMFAAANNQSKKFSVFGDGSVAVATGAAVIAVALDVNGTIRQESQISCSTGLTTDSIGRINGCVASDAKLKTAVRSYSKPGLIDDLNPVAYRWLSVPGKDSREHIGFIAQDVEKVAPKAVVSAGEKYKGLDSNALIAILVDEVKALRKRVAILEKKRGH